MIISICRHPRKSSLRSPTVVLHQRSRAAAPLATPFSPGRPLPTCSSIQESRRRKDPENSELAHHSGRGRKRSERNDVNAQPTLNDTSHNSAGGKAEERERDGPAQREVLVAQEPHRAEHRERQLHAGRIIHTGGLQMEKKLGKGMRNQSPRRPVLVGK